MQRRAASRVGLAPLVLRAVAPHHRTNTNCTTAAAAAAARNWRRRSGICLFSGRCRRTCRSNGRLLSPEALGLAWPQHRRCRGACCSYRCCRRHPLRLDRRRPALLSAQFLTAAAAVAAAAAKSPPAALPRAEHRPRMRRPPHIEATAAAAATTATTVTATAAARAARPVERHERSAHPLDCDAPHARAGPLGAVRDDGPVRVAPRVRVDGPRVVLPAWRSWVSKPVCGGGGMGMRPMHMGMRPVCGGGGMATDWRRGPLAHGRALQRAERALGLRRRECRVRR